MAEKEEMVLTAEQTAKMKEAREIVASAIGAQCTCSFARFAPDRLGLSYARGRIKDMASVSEVAGGLALCTGMADGMCHYPGAYKSEV